MKIKVNNDKKETYEITEDKGLAKFLIKRGDCSELECEDCPFFGLDPDNPGYCAVNLSSVEILEQK